MKALLLNKDDGYLYENKGAVGTNNGKINNNNNDVDNNAGSIIHNKGTVKTNNGKVNNNHYNSKVKSNRGTITENNGIVIENNGTVEHNMDTVEFNYEDGTVFNEGGTVGQNYGKVYERYPIQMGGAPSTDDELADAEVVVINGAKWIVVTKYDVIMSGLLSYLSEAEQEEFWLNRGFVNAIAEAPQGGTVTLDLTSGLDRLQGIVPQAMLARPDVTVKLLLPHGRTATISSATAAQYAERDSVLLTSLIG